MKPKIERIASATHFCRATAKLMLADKQDAYAVVYDENGVEMLKTHLREVFAALAIEVLEDIARDMGEENVLLVPEMLVVAFMQAVEEQIANARNFVMNKPNGLMDSGQA